MCLAVDGVVFAADEGLNRFPLRKTKRPHQNHRMKQCCDAAAAVRHQYLIEWRYRGRQGQTERGETERGETERGRNTP